MRPDAVSRFRLPFVPGCLAAPVLFFPSLPEGARVFFIRLRNLGEAVLDTATLRALCRYRPDLEITTLVEAIYADLYAADPDIRAMPLWRGGGDSRSSFFARLDVVREIRRRKFTAVINLHGGPTSAHLTWLGGARHRVGAAHFRHGYAYNLRIPPVELITGRKDLHTVEYQFEQFRALGLPGDRAPETCLFVTPEKRSAAHQKLRATGVDPAAPYAVLAPTNEFYTKRWMPERFAEVAGVLHRRGFQLVATGAPTEPQRLQLAAVASAATIPIALHSSLSIGELMAVIADAKLFVGNDSGPAHLASALKTPSVALFGPASSIRWRPWNPPSVLVQNSFACNPCSMYKCEAFDEPECIRSITVAQVIDAIDQVL